MTLEEMIQLRKQQEQNVKSTSQGSEDVKETMTMQETTTAQEKTDTNKIDTSKIDITKFEGSVKSKFVRPLIEEDVYNAVLKSIDLKTGLKDLNTGNLIDKFLWNFELISNSSGDAVTQDINGKPFDKAPVLSIFTNIAWGIKSTNYNLYCKITGKTPQKDEKYNILDCVEKKCRVNVTTHQPNGEGLPYSKIEGVMAPKK